MATTREALEAALAAEPESVALHSAYADLLIEEGDPRGEYIRLELMLEDETLLAEAREDLETRAFNIRTRNEPLWLGNIYEYAYPWKSSGNSRVPTSYLTLTWRRGWVTELENRHHQREILAALAFYPIIQFLQSLVLINVDWRRMENNAVELIQNISKLPIRRLSLDRFGRFGDELFDAILDLRLLEKLTELALTQCYITDDGAVKLASSPHVRNLKTLNLDNNHLSPIGIAALAEVGFTIGPQLDNPAWEDGRHNID